MSVLTKVMTCGKWNYTKKCSTKKIKRVRKLKTMIIIALRLHFNHRLAQKIQNCLNTNNFKVSRRNYRILFLTLITLLYHSNSLLSISGLRGILKCVNQKPIYHMFLFMKRRIFLFFSVLLSSTKYNYNSLNLALLLF